MLLLKECLVVQLALMELQAACKKAQDSFNQNIQDDKMCYIKYKDGRIIEQVYTSIMLLVLQYRDRDRCQDFGPLDVVLLFVMVMWLLVGFNLQTQSNQINHTLFYTCYCIILIFIGVVHSHATISDSFEISYKLVRTSYKLLKSKVFAFSFLCLFLTPFTRMMNH